MISRFWPMLACAVVSIAVVVHTGSAGAQSIAAGPTASPVVIELFTSQGCSSCPAADALLKSYAARRDVIALSLPVDYWDYLGWKDTFASPKFSKRQRAYAKLRGDGQVYTPQAVVNGRTHVNGSAKAEIDSAVKSQGGGGVPAVTSLSAAMRDGTITIELPVAAQAVDDATVWLAVVQAEAHVDIKSGENRGRKLTYFNVVRELVPLGMWSGAATTIKQQTSTLAGSSGDRYAVLLQKGMGGPILSATWVEAGR